MIDRLEEIKDSFSGWYNDRDADHDFHDTDDDVRTAYEWACKYGQLLIEQGEDAQLDKRNTEREQELIIEQSKMLEKQQARIKELEGDKKTLMFMKNYEIDIRERTNSIDWDKWAKRPNCPCHMRNK